MSDIELRVKFSGEAGDGIVTAGTILMETVANLGYNATIYKTFPSNLRSGYSMSMVTISNRKIDSPVGLSDVLITLNLKYLERDIVHSDRVNTFLFDSTSGNSSNENCISILKEQAEVFYDIPFSKIAMKINRSSLTKNMVAIGAVSHLFNIPMYYFEESIKKRYAERSEKIIAQNLDAIHAGNDWIKTRNGKN